MVQKKNIELQMYGFTKGFCTILQFTRKMQLQKNGSET